MAGKKKAKKKRKSPARKPVEAAVTSGVVDLDEAAISAMMYRCDSLRFELHNLTLQLLVEQRQRRHEQRMAMLKQLGSAAALVPVTAVKSAIEAGRGVAGFIRHRIAAMRRTQESPS